MVHTTDGDLLGWDGEHIERLARCDISYKSLNNVGDVRTTKYSVCTSKMNTLFPRHIRSNTHKSDVISVPGEMKLIIQALKFRIAFEVTVRRYATEVI